MTTKTTNVLIRINKKFVFLYFYDILEKMKVRDSYIDYLSQYFKQIVRATVFYNGISLQFDRIGEDDNEDGTFNTSIYDTVLS